VRVRAKRALQRPHPTGYAGHLLPEGEGKGRLSLIGGLATGSFDLAHCSLASLCFGIPRAPLSYGRGGGVRVRAKRAFAFVAVPHPVGFADHLLSGEKGGAPQFDRNSGDRIV
jgi:hypothetical protein